MRVRGIIEHKKCLAKKPDRGLTIYVHEGAANRGYMVFARVFSTTVKNTVLSESDSVSGRTQ